MEQSTPLNIAIISPFQLRVQRGIERFAGNLATELAATGQQVTLLTWSGSGQPDPRTSQHGVKWQVMPPVRYFETWWAGVFYAQALVRLRPDVVVVFFAGYGEAAALALSSPTWRPRIVFVAGYPFELVPHRFMEFRKWGLRHKLDAIVVKARHMAPAIEQFFVKGTELIPNGIDLTRFNPHGATSSQSKRESCSNLVTVAALEKRKGFDLVLRALPYVVEKTGPIHYVVVGDGPDRAWLQAQVEQKGLSESVSLVGAVDDVRPYLAQADLFLLPSYGEGLPNAYLEALAMGLPTIVSAYPPYDAIARSEFSIRVDRNNPEAMTQAIVQLLNDPGRRSRMSQAARDEVEKRYAWPVVTHQYRTLFSQLVKDRLK